MRCLNVAPQQDDAITGLAVGSHPLERGQRIAQRLLGAGGIRQGIALAASTC
jgi:hypothetical protein